MFFIKSKSKKITIDFFTDDYAIYDLFKIEKTIKHKPHWLSNDLMIKHCAGMNDFFSKSFIIRSWADFHIYLTDNMDVQMTCSNSETCIGANEVKERGHFLPPDVYQHIKIPMPWYAKPSQSIPCAFYGASWHSERYLSYLQYLPSVRDLYYSREWNIHYFLNKESMKNSVEIINSNDALQYILPLTDKPVEVKNHYDPDMVKKLRSYNPRKFSLRSPSHYRLKKLMKDNEHDV